VADVPTQFWVMDLEDGFTEEPEGDTVGLDQIASVPMLALWEGITAVPWKGPPRVDTRGFLSVLAGSAANPDLEPAVGTARYSARNYFIIARNFCNLHSRFGYHFSIVEAMVESRPQRNYIIFRFEGGAASFERRRRRAQLVADILIGHGFDVRLTDDTLRARLEGFEQERMIRCLKIVGYLTMHTRQLDMVMNDPDEAARQRERITADIAGMVG
jgi:pyruvate,water dikinase